ncbi:MAG: iron ABC transporter permease [Nitrospinae bacterium]|nr:iron ABC transporter permease [Nitrospinota bacterium]MBL7020437.1 iron ABC transporter permease [Nitrospinaceae bacterium]
MSIIMGHYSYKMNLVIFLLLFLATLCVTPLIGSTQIDLANALSGGVHAQNNLDANILFQVRLPRILLGAVAGAALSVAGAVFQALLRNDLAAPFTLGVSSGAALGAVLAIVFNLNISILGFPMVSLFSFLGALGAIFLVFSLVRTRHGEFPTSILLLAGVTANFFFASMVMFLHYISDFGQSFRIIRWLMGGLDITDYQTVLSIAPMVFLGIGLLIYVGRDLNLISTGVHSATSRGVNVPRIQRIGFITASLITGTVVAITGPIGFVGLIVPHISRLFVGSDLRILIPVSMLFGASFLIICDTVARTLIAPTEIPVGIITAMLGGPFFVWLLKRKRQV